MLLSWPQNNTFSVATSSVLFLSPCVFLFCSFFFGEQFFPPLFRSCCQRIERSTYTSLDKKGKSVVGIYDVDCSRLVVVARPFPFFKSDDLSVDCVDGTIVAIVRSC
jgi:hypothetical protein